MMRDGSLIKAHGCVATTYVCRKANSRLPVDLFGRNLQDLRGVRPDARCRDWLSGPRRMATGRGRNGRPRRSHWRKLGFSGTQDYGRGNRRNNSLAYNPRQQELAGVLAFWEIVCCGGESGAERN